MYESSFVPNQDSFSLDSIGVQRIPHSATPDTYYVVSLTPEHNPMAQARIITLCEYHYIQAASCLMIRRVLRVKSSGECKFCS